MFSNVGAAVDGVIDNGLWASSPFVETASCSDVAYLTIEYSASVTITGITVWHFYGDQRQYCSQSIEFSATGAFSGEQSLVFACGSFEDCGDTQAEGRVVWVESQQVRYIRVGSSRNNRNTGVHILEVRPHVSLAPEPPMACDSLIAPCVNTNGSFYCSCLPGLGGEGISNPVSKSVGIENGVILDAQRFQLSEKAEHRSGYIWHPKMGSGDVGQILYTTWLLDVGPVQDFVITTTVFFESIGNTAASFVFWTPDAQFVGMDGSPGSRLFVSGSVFGGLTLFSSRVSYLHPYTWHDITFRRTSGVLDVAVDGIVVMSEIYMPVGFSSVSWRPWRATMRIRSLKYQELQRCAVCGVGYFSSESTKGQCTLCPAGTFGDEPGASACTECATAECADVNECELGTDNCDTSYADCENTIDSFVCACKEGFETEDDGVNCFEGVDECLTAEHNCDLAVSFCNNTLGSFSCPCMDGLESIDGACREVDECALGLDNCQNAVCVNTNGSFACECDPGLKLEYTDGFWSCLDVDECAIAQGPTDGLVGVWRLASDAADYSGFGNHMISMGVDFSLFKSSSVEQKVTGARSRFSNVGAAVDGVIDNGLWASSPFVEAASCSDVAYLTIEYSASVTITGITVWHFYGDQRQYCSQSIEFSATGAFSGEQSLVFACGSFEDCGDTQAEGRVVWVESQQVRYIRVGSSRNNRNTGVHILEVRPHVILPRGIATNSADLGSPFPDGYAIFRGGSDYAMVSGWNPRQCDNSGMTVEFWWKPTGPRGDIMSVISLGYPGNDNAFLFTDGWQSHDQDCEVCEGGSCPYAVPNLDKCATDNEWHHIAYTRHGTQRYLYIDGEQLWEWVAPDTQVLGPGGTLVLGQDQDRPGGGFQANRAFAGYLTEVRIWNLARTQEQIVDTMHERLFGCGVYPMTREDPADAPADPCNNTIGGFTCGCASGWDAQGGLGCVDVNECANALHNCAPTAACVNNPGSFTCACNTGWISDGPASCVDFDECSSNRVDRIPSLVAVWPLTLDTSDSTRALDTSGNEQHMTQNGLTFADSDPQAPLPGGYAYFSGAVSSYAISDRFDPQLDAGALTVELWWRPKVGARQWFFAILSWAIENSGRQDNDALMLYDGYESKWGDVGEYECVVKEWETNYYSQDNLDTCKADGRWHHVAFTKTSNPEAVRTIYYDGEVIATWSHGADTFHRAGGRIALGQQWKYVRDYVGGPWYLSSKGFTSSTAFEGWMTEVRLWNVARTQEQINETMHTRLPQTLGYCDADNAACINTAGSFSCACNPGYESEDGAATCVAGVDECFVEQDVCDASNSTCVNTVGSYTCACRKGFVYNSTLGECEDVDECQQAQQSSDGLVAVWRLAADGTDYSGYEQHMVASVLDFRRADGGAPFLDGYAVFNSEGHDYAKVVDFNPRMNPSGEFSVEFWWKPIGPRVSFMTVLSLAYLGDEDAFLLTDGFNSLNCLPNVFLGAESDCSFGRCGVYTGPKTDTCAVDKTWHHVAFSKTANPNPVRKFYYDGQLIQTWSDGADELFIRGGTLVLGQDQDGVGGGSSPSRAFRGYLTEVRWWSVSRTQAQIQGAMHVRLFGCGIHVTECGHVATTGELCTNLVGGYVCECVQGWKSMNGGRTCVDVNECEELVDICGANARCVNTVGSFECECSAGWRSGTDGTSCVDNDECFSAQDQTAGLVGMWRLASDTSDFSGYEQHMANLGLDFDNTDASSPFADGYAVFDDLGDDAAVVSSWNPRQCGDSSQFTLEFWWKPSLGVRDSFLSAVSINLKGDDRAFVVWDGYGQTDSDLDCCFGKDCAFVGPKIDTCKYDGGWHHVAFSKTAGPSPVREFYYDGVLIQDWSDGEDELWDTEASIFLGRQPSRMDGSYERSNSFKGYITEVRIWNVARTQQQILGTMHVRLFGCGIHVTACGTAVTAVEHCTNTEGSYTCACNPGFTTSTGGRSCLDIDECADPALCDPNHGECANTEGGYECNCAAGFESEDGGVTCTDADECLSATHSCDPNAICTNTAGHFSCTCQIGYMGEGLNCTEVDECSEGIANCHKDSACTNSAGSFACQCFAGYSGDGVTCTVCPQGFNTTHIGMVCQDVDECYEALDNCDGNATCVNTHGSFTCECYQGFASSDEGITCQYQCGYLCDPKHAVCQNTSSGYECMCLSGWESTDGGRSCTDVNECELAVWEITPLCNETTEFCENRDGSYECITPHTCSFNEECGAGYECAFLPSCEETGTNCYKRCIDIDECSGKEDPCEMPMRVTGKKAKAKRKVLCLNEPGSFQCYTVRKDWCARKASDGSESSSGSSSSEEEESSTLPVCAEGYRCLSLSNSKKKTTCVNINECLEGRHSCAYNQECEDELGSYSCNDPPPQELKGGDASNMADTYGAETGRLHPAILIGVSCVSALLLVATVQWMRRRRGSRASLLPKKEIRGGIRPIETLWLWGTQTKVTSELMLRTESRAEASMFTVNEASASALEGARRLPSMEGSLRSVDSWEGSTTASQTELLRVDYLARGERAAIENRIAGNGESKEQGALTGTVAEIKHSKEQGPFAGEMFV